MIVKLLSNTPDPEKVCAAAAWNCTHVEQRHPNSFMYEEAADLVARVLSRGHTSIAEHAVFTFGIEGISRACANQLVRHRIASYAQQSQRYVEGMPFLVVPPSIEAHESAHDAFVEAKHQIEAIYIELLELGIPSEDVRYILPNAAKTNIQVTMNARQLVTFFQQRLCKRAQWEIRYMAEGMLACLDGPLFEQAKPQCSTCTDICN